MDSSQFNTIIHRFDAVDIQLHDLATRATMGAARSLVHEEILEQLAASIQRMDQYAARLDVTIAQHEERLARMDERIAQNEASLTQHAVRIAQNEDLLRQHDTRMASLDETARRLADLLERFDQGRNGR